MTTITITVENEKLCVTPGAGTTPPPDPLPAPLPAPRSGCAFFRMYQPTASELVNGQLTKPEFKNINIYTVGIVDNASIIGYTPRHNGFTQDSATGTLDLSALNPPAGCIVFVHGEWI